MIMSRAFRQARDRAGLSQKEAADVLGVSNVTVCRWERGKTQPIAEQLVRMSKVYGVTLDELCGLKPL